MSLTPSKRVIKIGLVKDGRLISENVLKEKQIVTIGTDAANTIVVSDRGLPKRHVVLEETPQGFRLNVLPKMNGVVMLPSGSQDLAELGSRSGNGSVPVSLGSVGKGKIEIGNSTVLFQLVPPPPPPPLTKLPADMQGRFIDRIDVAFLIIILLSVVTHFGLVRYIGSLPVQDSLSQKQLDDLVRLIPDDKLENWIPPEVAEEQKPEEKPEEGEGAGKKTGGGGGKPKGPGDGAGDGTTEEKSVESVGLLSMLTTGDGGGAVNSILNDNGLGGGIDDALGKVGGAVAVAGGPGIGGSRGGGNGSGPTSVGPAGIGNTGVKEGAGTGGKTEKTVKAAPPTSSGSSSGSMDAGSIASKIRGYTGGIRSCYERQLKIDPTLQGKVSVQFTIGGDGSVQGCSVTASTIASSDVGDCVCGRIRRWHFDPSEDGSGSQTANYSFIFTPAAD